MGEKITISGRITNENGVLMVFSKIHEKLGFPTLVSPDVRGFDISSIRYRKKEVTVEFEYLSSNFILHQHHLSLDPNKDYVVVCWADDCGLKTLLKKDFGIELFEVIQLSEYAECIDEAVGTEEQVEPIYAILSYNPKDSGGLDFSNWAFSHCFRINSPPGHPKFSNDHLPPGSRILFSHKSYIIGGFTVVRYEVIEKPATAREWKLYKTLTDYPCSLFTVEIDEYQREFYRGHIFYSDFFVSTIRVKMSDVGITKKMPQGGKLNITKEEYLRIIGR
ncbi:MAG TPA: hypothetical protein PK176_11230 [Acidobacteriota bacterium]|nr:hypothetical protein [Acidobacteriota bacterium]HQM63876.1 hypothetical protein [Acidobacteriota bacterium]